MTGVRFPLPAVIDASLAWFESLGYAVKHGPEIASGELFAERAVTMEEALERTV
jgi:hypothetical protein